MATGRERQEPWRERRRQAGQQRVELWREAETLAELEALREHGERLEALVVRALRALQGVTGDSASSTRDTAVVTSDALLLTCIRLFFPQDKPVYPRRAYGLRTLPLWALHRVLARQGYVLHAVQVRNADWCVACSDHDGRTEPFGVFELRRAAGAASGGEALPAMQRLPPQAAQGVTAHADPHG